MGYERRGGDHMPTPISEKVRILITFGQFLTFDFPLIGQPFNNNPTNVDEARLT